MMELFYTYYRSPAGVLKIAATGQFITQVLFIDDVYEIDDSIASTPLLLQAAEQLIEYFSGHRRIFNLPVCQHGTVFQNRVWNELTNIGFGKTISYMDLAKRLGDPKSIRAAASSNGKNNLCIIVPCHRVIGTDRSLTGYSGGLWRKKWLLDHENKIANGVQTFF